MQNNASISSMKITQGCIFLAKEKTAEASLSLSPYHLSVKAAESRFKNRMPASLAVALAIWWVSIYKIVSRMGSNLFDTGGSTPSYFPSVWSDSENLYFPVFGSSSLLIGRPYVLANVLMYLCTYVLMYPHPILIT